MSITVDYFQHSFTHLLDHIQNDISKNYTNYVFKKSAILFTETKAPTSVDTQKSVQEISP